MPELEELAAAMAQAQVDRNDEILSTSAGDERGAEQSGGFEVDTNVKY